MVIFILILIHTGVVHTDNESAQHFDSENLLQIVLVLRTGFEPLVFGSRVDALPTEPPRHPYYTHCAGSRLSEASERVQSASREATHPVILEASLVGISCTGFRPGCGLRFANNQRNLQKIGPNSMWAAISVNVEIH